MSPVPGLPEKIAASLVISLLKASAGIVRKRLSQSDARKALEAAIAAALAEALEGQELRDRDEDWEHYGSLLEDFFAREEVAFELAQLLDPRPDQAPDLTTLAHEFRMAGYDPETMPGFDLDAFLRAFFSAFYAAAGLQEPLRGGIDLKLLGTQLQQVGVVVSEVRRVADSLERIELVIGRFVAGKSEEEEFRRIVEAARAEGFLAAYRTFEDIGSGLLKAGVDLGVDSRGVLEILPRGSEASRALPPARLEAVRLLAGELRSAILDHSPNDAELNALEVRYRQHIIRWFENLTFQGMMRAPKPIVLPLEEVYVELRAVAEVPEAADAFSVEERRLLLESEEKDETKRRELMSQLDAFRRERWSRTIPERKSMAEALHQRDRRAFVILGDPGSGKTTLLHFLALVYARGPETAAQRLGVDLAEANRLPIFVPLAAFDDMLRESQREGRSLTLREFLPRYYDRRRGLPGLEPLFRRAFESGRALVLLDGLDEVLDVGTRNYVAQQADALIGELPGVRFAVSSRFVGYREAPLNLPTLSVLDFGTPEIETFVRRWAHAFEKWAANGIESPEMLRRAQTLESGLMDDVRSNESVRRLAANPLMLRMLALLRRQLGRLPHRRVQLYESYVGTLLENWVDARSEGARERSVEILDQPQAESILIPLAFWLQREKPSGTAGRVEIRNKLVEICLEDRGLDPAQAERSAVREAERQAERFLQEMRQMAGLIVERGHDAFGFLHLTFQEYFAGRALAQLGDKERWEAILPNLHDPRWREPILLCAGRLGVVENRRAQVTQLVRNILDNNDPTEADLHRNLLCALSIACDDVSLEPALVTDLVDRAVTQLSTQVYGFARELLRLLGLLVANGMLRFEDCLGPVEESEDYSLKLSAIEEWGRFVDVQEVKAWLRKQLDSEDPECERAALDALAFQIDTDRDLWQKAIDCLGLPYVDKAAARALSRIVQSEAEVRQALLDILGKEFLALPFAIEEFAGLIRSDAEVRNMLLEKLHHSDDWFQELAVRGLSTLVGEDPVVRKRFTQIVLDAEAVARDHAISALASLVGKDNDVRQTVLACLQDQDKEVRLAAVNAISETLITDQEALSIAIDLLSREKTVEVLEELKFLVFKVPDVRQIFLEKLEVQDWNVRRIACQGLAEGGLASIENLRAVLRSQECLEALAILEECAFISKERREKRWCSFWHQMLKRSEPRVQKAAVDALGSRVILDEGVRHVALKQLIDEDYHARISAILVLSGMVRTDEEVRRAVLQRLGDEQQLVRESAISALARLVGADEELRCVVLECLKNENSDVRASAISVLSGVVGTDRKVRLAVMDRLGDKGGYVQISALSALSSAVSTDEEVRRSVLGLVEDGGPAARSYAIESLSNLVTTDKEVRRALLERLKDEDPAVRGSALSALSVVVDSDEEVRRAVIELLADEDSICRMHAVSALTRALRMDARALRGVLERLDDDGHLEVRVTSLSALSEVVETNREVRRKVLDFLQNKKWLERGWFEIRQQAVLTLSNLLGEVDVRQTILLRLDDQEFPVRLRAVELVAQCHDEALFESLRTKLWDWLNIDDDWEECYEGMYQFRDVHAQLANRFGAKLPSDISLRDALLERLREPRWSARLGAALALLAWPGGPPDEIMTQVLAALEDRRGLEAYPAQLTAASYLINRNDTAAEAIDLCLEALDYGTQPWEHLGRSRAVRQQAALVLGKLEPVFYDARIYDKLLHVLRNDEAADVRDAAYGTLVRLARMREQQAVA